MTQKCDLYGSLKAAASIEKMGTQSDESLDMPFDSQMSYAETMENKTRIQVAKIRNIEIKKYAEDRTNFHLVRDLIDSSRNWSALIPERSFKPVDARMQKFFDTASRVYQPRIDKLQERYNEQLPKIVLPIKSKATQAKIAMVNDQLQAAVHPILQEMKSQYRADITKYAAAERQKLQDLYNTYNKQPEKLNARLKARGLDITSAYHLENYYRFLENGDPFGFNFNPGGGAKMNAVSKLIKNKVGNSVAFNSLTAAFNLTEVLQKGIATHGFADTMMGIVDAQKLAAKEGKTIFSQLNSMKRKGAYGTRLGLQRIESRFDPVARSQNFLDNAGRAIGERAGNGAKGSKDIAYQPKAWDDTLWYADGTNRGKLDFMQFQFRHMQQYGGWVKDIIGKDSTLAQRKDGAKMLIAYTTVGAAMFGAKSAIPAIPYQLWKQLDGDIDKKIDAVFGGIGKGGVRLATNDILDPAEYAQPLGGVGIGIGMDMVNGLLQAATQSAPRAIKYAREGRADKAVVLAGDTLIRLSQVMEGGANAFQQKSSAALTKAYIEDNFTLENIFKQGLIKNAGAATVPRLAKFLKGRVSESSSYAPSKADLGIDKASLGIDKASLGLP